MKSFLRAALLFMAATLIAGCAVSVVDAPSVNPAPASVADNRAFAPTTVPPKAPAIPTATPTVTPLPTLVTGNSIGIAAHDLSDGDPSLFQDIRPLQKASANPAPSPDPPNPAALVSKPSHPLEGAELYVYIPPQTKTQQPLRVLVALHGMGGRGDVFSQSLIKDADRNNWVIIAPTFQYHNYLDPKELMDDDIQFTKRLLDTLDVLPQRLNLKLRQHVLLYGFSRGAQLAHRFAYFYPDRVESVVTLSAGAYTLPTEKQPTDKGSQVIPFPYGIGDLKECVGQPVNWPALKKISFWIGVGAQDDQAGDVARAFDQYGGKTRVERAKTFQQALQAIGIDVHLVIFPDATHEVTTDMRVGGMQFLRDDELADHWDD